MVRFVGRITGQPEYSGRAIQVEHNPDPGEVVADATHGAGQALRYAAELENAVPVVVVNSTDQDRAGLDALRRGMPVVEWSQPGGSE